MRLLSVAAMKSLEDAANGAGYSYEQMMQNAGMGVAKKIHSKYFKKGNRAALGLVGSGNNGGDTLVALTELRKWGWQVGALLFKERKSEDPLFKSFLEVGGNLVKPGDVNLRGYADFDSGILLDGVYGTGFHLPMAKHDEEIFKIIQAQLPNFTVVAVDCPSGVDCQSGEAAEATLRASLTLCLEAVKPGLITPTGLPYCGEIEMVDLGLSKYSPKESMDAEMVVGIADVRRLIPRRDEFSHKGTFGKTMVAGGSVNYPGAPILASRGAYAVGTGLVQTAVPEAVYLAAAASNLELTWLILDDTDGVIAETAADTLRDYAGQSQCMVLGPGAGREETTTRFIHKLLFSTSENGRNIPVGFIGVGNGKVKKEKHVLPPMVIDADALTLIAREKDWVQKIQTKVVLTPHPGEMATLTGLPVDEIQAQRVEIARRYARQWKQTVVLKGGLTVIAGEDGKIGIIPVATSALAKAGTGDVLAGMIGGLMAQGLPTWDAAVTGAWIHAQAGRLAGRRMGANESVLASDVLRSISEVYRRIHAGE